MVWLTSSPHACLTYLGEANARVARSNHPLALTASPHACSFLPAKDCAMGSCVCRSFAHALTDDQIWRELLQADFSHRAESPLVPDGTVAESFRYLSCLFHVPPRLQLGPLLHPRPSLWSSCALWLSLSSPKCTRPHITRPHITRPHITWHHV